MIYLGFEIVLPRKRELVWSVLADAQAYPSWVEGLKEVSAIGATDAMTEGAAFDVTFRVPRVDVEATTVVTRVRAAELVAFETRVRERLVLFDRIALETVSDGTRLVATSELGEDAGVMRLFHRSSGLLGAREQQSGPQKIYERSFRAFGKLVEARTAAPYR